MLPRRVRRASAPLLLLSVLLATACSRTDPPERVTAEGPGAAGQAVPSSTAPPTTAATEATSASSTTVVAPEPEGTDASVVAGLSADQLAELIAVPSSRSTRSLGGPSLEQVRSGGTTAWRVRVPGRVEARSARVQVLVAGRVVGQGIPEPDLGALVAVTLDGRGLVAGAPVQVQWEGRAPEAVGTLAVVR